MYQQTLEELSHIKDVYSLEEILKQYNSGNYNSELLLQHSVIHLSYLVKFLEDLKYDELAMD
jgi:hypothetical protein